MTPAALELTDVVKDFRGLRPLRIERLTVAVGESTALVGLDRPMAEVFVNLVTGATLPDRGEVNVFGRATSAVTDSADWLALVDRFGIVSERAVLLGALSVVQNLAMPFTLDIEPPDDDVQRRAERLAKEVGLAESDWPARVSSLDALGHVRVRLARALALDPAVLLLEHVTADVPRADTRLLGRSIRAVADRRQLAMVVLTADLDFAKASASRVLTLDLPSGRLTKQSRLFW